MVRDKDLPDISLALKAFMNFIFPAVHVLLLFLRVFPFFFFFFCGAIVGFITYSNALLILLFATVVSIYPSPASAGSLALTLKRMLSR